MLPDLPDDLVFLHGAMHAVAEEFAINVYIKKSFFVKQMDLLLLLLIPNFPPFGRLPRGEPQVPPRIWAETIECCCKGILNICLQFTSKLLMIFSVNLMKSWVAFTGVV
jgi:hypothetical protein